MGRLNKELLKEVVSSSTYGLAVLEARSWGFEIIFANQSFASICGKSIGDLEGTAWTSHLAGDAESAELPQMQEALAGGQIIDLDSQLLGDAGDGRHVRLRLKPLRSGSTEGRFALVEYLGEGSAAGDPVEFSEPESAGASGIDRADTVTGLMTRRQFESLLRRKLSSAKRENFGICLMLFSIPELDVYRQTFGDNSADSCLRMIAAQIAGTFRRATDLCARLDEDRFAVALLGQSEQQARGLIEQVQNKARSLGLHNPRGRQGRYIFIRGSVTVADPAHDGVPGLIERACDAFEDGEVEMPSAAAGTG